MSSITVFSKGKIILIIIKKTLVTYLSQSLQQSVPLSRVVAAHREAPSGVWFPLGLKPRTFFKAGVITCCLMEPQKPAFM